MCGNWGVPLKEILEVFDNPNVIIVLGHAFFITWLHVSNCQYKEIPTNMQGRKNVSSGCEWIFTHYLPQQHIKTFLHLKTSHLYREKVLEKWCQMASTSRRTIA